MTAEVVSNNRFRPAAAPDDAAFGSSYSGTDTAVDLSAVSDKAHLLPKSDAHTNGHIQTIPEDAAIQHSGTRGIFSLKQVRRNITRQLSLDDFDFQAARERNDQIEQIALHDPELCVTATQGKMQKAWVGFLSTLSDTFTVARLTIRLSAYLIGGEHLYSSALLLIAQLQQTLRSQCKVTKVCLSAYRWHMGPSSIPLGAVYLLTHAWICSGKLNLSSCIAHMHFLHCLH